MGSESQIEREKSRRSDGSAPDRKDPKSRETEAVGSSRHPTRSSGISCNSVNAFVLHEVRLDTRAN